MTGARVNGKMKKSGARVNGRMTRSAVLKWNMLSVWGK